MLPCQRGNLFTVIWSGCHMTEPVLIVSWWIVIVNWKERLSCSSWWLRFISNRAALAFRSSHGWRSRFTGRDSQLHVHELISTAQILPNVTHHAHPPRLISSKNSISHSSSIEHYIFSIDGSHQSAHRRSINLPCKACARLESRTLALKHFPAVPCSAPSSAHHGIAKLSGRERLGGAQPPCRI